mmetsp:Transcript_58921/g.175314  ORF Transcript_58921/g.175314 Transcript_58921/m.175314 type:complete len:405 (+) Transcript_58921:500-1714(+)
MATPAGGPAQGTAAAVRAPVEVHVRVKVGVEVEGEDEASPILPQNLLQECVHLRLARVDKRAPRQRVSAEDARERHLREAQGVKLCHGCLELLPEAASGPKLLDALRRHWCDLPPVAQAVEELQLIADAETHDVRGPKHFQEALGPSPALRVKRLIAGHLRAKQDLDAVGLHEAGEVAPRGHAALRWPFGIPGLEEAEGLHGCLGVGEEGWNAIGTLLESRVVQRHALVGSPCHRPQVEAARAVEGRARPRRHLGPWCRRQGLWHGRAKGRRDRREGRRRGRNRLGAQTVPGVVVAAIPVAAAPAVALAGVAVDVACATVGSAASPPPLRGDVRSGPRAAELQSVDRTALSAGPGGNALVILGEALIRKQVLVRDRAHGEGPEDEDKINHDALMRCWQVRGGRN